MYFAKFVRAKQLRPGRVIVLVFVDGDAASASIGDRSGTAFPLSRPLTQPIGFGGASRISQVDIVIQYHFGHTSTTRGKCYFSTSVLDLRPDTFRFTCENKFDC